MAVCFWPGTLLSIWSVKIWDAEHLNEMRKCHSLVPFAAGLQNNCRVPLVMVLQVKGSGGENMNYDLWSRFFSSFAWMWWGVQNSARVLANWESIILCTYNTLFFFEVIFLQSSLCGFIKQQKKGNVKIAPPFMFDVGKNVWSYINDDHWVNAFSWF